MTLISKKTALHLIQFTLTIFHKNSDRDQNKSVHCLLEGKQIIFSSCWRERKKTVFKMSGICRERLKTGAYVKCTSYPFAISLRFVSVNFQLGEKKCNKSVYRNHTVCRSGWKISCWNFNTYPSPVFTVLSQIEFCCICSFPRSRATTEGIWM